MIPSEFKKIDTRPKTIEEVLKGIKRERVKLPAPTTKAEAQKYLRLYIELFDYYDSEMKRIKKVVIPKLKEIIKKECE